MMNNSQNSVNTSSVSHDVKALCTAFVIELSFHPVPFPVYVNY